MAYFFGDGFDCYAASADTLLGYWDSGTTGNFNLTTGRFSGSRAIAFVSGASVTPYLFKSSGQNDAVHHISVAFMTSQTSTTTGGFFITFYDGATAQCTISFWNGTGGNGNIDIKTGSASGANLASYVPAFTPNTWYHFEFEVVINNTTGSFKARRNGNTSDDFSATGLNTRGGTANNYANRIGIGQQQSYTGHNQDDFLWRSDASSVLWLGDIRCYTRRPDIDISAAWTPSGSAAIVTPFPTTTTTGALTTARYYSFTAPCNGTVTSATMALTVAATASFKAAIYEIAGGVPTNVLGAVSNVVTNPGIGTFTFTFPTPASVTRGTQYFFSFMQSAASGTFQGVSARPAYYAGSFLSGGQTYATFPVANPAGASGTANAAGFTVYITPTSGTNAPMVLDDLQDAATTYVYSTAPGAQDLYTLTDISSTPSTIVGVTTRGLFTKSDAGTRNAAVQLRSGGTTVQSAGVLSNTAWGWLWRSDTTDPATGAAWTVSGVAAAQIGAQVTG